MKDAIDKRNEKERIARGIVKRRNIVYISREEAERRRMEEERRQKMQEDREAAEKLVHQLKEDEDKKRAMEIERLLAEQEMLEKQLATGMDATGKKPMSEVTQERVEAILSEKSKQLQDLIASHSMAVGKESETVEASGPADLAPDGSGAEAGGGPGGEVPAEADGGDAARDGAEADSLP